MSDQEVIDAAIAKVEELSDPAVLSFLSYIENEGLIMPEEELTFFLDLRSSAEADRLRAELEGSQLSGMSQYQKAIADWDESSPHSVSDVAPVPSDFGVLDAGETQAKIEELTAKVYESRIIFKLRGASPKDQRALDEAITNEARSLPEDQRAAYTSERMADELAALSIQSVSIPAKGMNIEKVNAAAARRLVSSLPGPDVDKFFRVLQTLNTAAVLVDPVVDAGFPSEHAGAATEPDVRDAAAGG